MNKRLSYLIMVLLVLDLALANAVTADLVGWWKMDDGSGTIAHDSTQNGNHGTLLGNPQWVAGYVGGALKLDGTDDYVSLPIGSMMSSLTNSTLALWVNFSGQGGAWQRVLDFGTSTANYIYVCPQDGGGALHVAITANTGSWTDIVAPTGGLPTGWHHLAVAIDGKAKNLKIFLDGQVVADAATLYSLSDLGNTTQNWLGRSEYADPYFNGVLDDFRIYNEALSAAQIGKIVRGVMAPASKPSPADGAVDVPRDRVLSWNAGEFAKTHDVYLGTVSADVQNADRASPLNVLVSRGQDASSYAPPAVLELGKTYYWRIDEVNAAPSTTIFKGDVWQFTVEPYSYPIRNVTATASSTNKGMEPQKTVDGSGLNAGDEHSTVATEMWLSAKGAAQPAWIQYTFDRTYKLDQMWVWNSNQALESVLGVGAKTVLVEYSTDAGTWRALGEFEFTQAGGLPATHDTTVDFGGAAAKFVKLTIKSNWGGILPQAGLSEVRFYAIPVLAREPNPAPAAIAVNPQVPLTWRAGREAVSHQIYIGTDKQQVTDGTAPMGTVSTNTYEAPVTLGQTYYWKVVEVNDAMTPKSWDGDVWSFTTADSLVVDDFESYTDEKDHEIFGTWIDGWSSGSSGSQVGYLQVPFAERTIVHGGRQAMPMAYDNNKAPRFSETERTFQVPQDWSKYGITTLVIWFRGDPNNTAAPLYAEINGTKVLFNKGAPSTAFPLWKQWNIDLASLGISLKSVKTLTIGVGDGTAGGTGMLFIDDVLLYATAPQVVAPADPGTNGLVLLYAMEGNVQDTSGKGNHGTVSGEPLYGPGPNGYGKALKFDGLNDYVNLPIGTLLSTLSNITVATWVNYSGTGGGWQRVWDFGTGTTNYMFVTPAQGTTGPMTFAIRTATVAEKRFAAARSLPTGWHHVAVVIDGGAMAAQVYLDGAVVSSSSVTVLPKDLGVTNQNWIGRSQFTADAFFSGAVDDFRIYNRAMSAAEIRYLAGDR
jgi:hypothetical protein